jgi:hypothetical protein
MGLAALPTGRGPGSKELDAVLGCVPVLVVLAAAGLGEELEIVERLIVTVAVSLVCACSATAHSTATPVRIIVNNRLLSNLILLNKTFSLQARGFPRDCGLPRFSAKPWR